MRTVAIVGPTLQSLELIDNDVVMAAVSCLTVADEAESGERPQCVEQSRV